MRTQLTLFDEPITMPVDLRISRSGTFLDNMALPIHRWFKYSAGFSAQWVERLLDDWKIDSRHVVLDPFAGSGTVMVVCDTRKIRSIGIEANPFVARISRAKQLWTTPHGRFTDFANRICNLAREHRGNISSYPSLIHRSFDEKTLGELDALKTSWIKLDDQSSESELIWLVITTILRSTSSAGTAQWQYILPNKTKKKILSPQAAFEQMISMMTADMFWMQSRSDVSLAEIVTGDVRNCSNIIKTEIDGVITSPPYANNYDYADTLRFEMSFWGDINGWGDLHDKVRQYLIVSSSQHSSKDKLDIENILKMSAVAPIHDELKIVVDELANVRLNHGGKKHYHTMVAAYCRDISLSLQQLRKVCRRGSKMCWVIGDSAPYGVYCPVDRWIGELSRAAGFTSYSFEKLRDRNIKWKNRKHRVPLKEGLLFIEG